MFNRKTKEFLHRGKNTHWKKLQPVLNAGYFLVCNLLRGLLTVSLLWHTQIKLYLVICWSKAVNFKRNWCSVWEFVVVSHQGFCHLPCSVLSRHLAWQCTSGITLLLTSCPFCVSPGFMTYIVEPLFERWAQFTGNTPLSENMLNHLRRNKAKWRSLLHKQHSSSRSNDHSGQVTSSQEQTLNEEETP